MKFNQQEMDAWLASRPPEIQALAKEFPMGTPVAMPEGEFMVIGYREGDGLVISPVDPSVDYEAAMEKRVNIHAAHLRDPQ